MRALIYPALIILIYLVVREPTQQPTRLSKLQEVESVAETLNPNSDLKLIAKLKGSRAILAGETPWIELTLLNSSNTLAYPIVKPGDGSEVGWRDPYVFFTAERLDSEGRWLTVPKEQYGRCGLYNADRPKDVIDLNRVRACISSLGARRS